MSRARSDEVADLLPLRPVQFSILLVLRAAPLHGYGVMQRVNAHLGRRELVGAGTLYRTLKEMREAGLVAHVPPPDSEADVDGRRQYYELTGLGSRVVEAEAQRIAGLLEEARLGTWIPGSETPT